jgi:hypothetical protein
MKWDKQTTANKQNKTDNVAAYIRENCNKSITFSFFLRFFILRLHCVSFFLELGENKKCEHKKKREFSGFFCVAFKDYLFMIVTWCFCCC